MNMRLTQILKEIRYINYDLECILQILADLEKAYSFDENNPTYIYIRFINQWLLKQRKQMDSIADMIDEETILLYQEQKN